MRLLDPLIVRAAVPHAREHAPRQLRAVVSNGYEPRDSAHFGEIDYGTSPWRVRLKPDATGFHIACHNLVRECG
jgi:hypothetical protein